MIISLEKNKARLETSIRELENNIEDSERQLNVAQDRERLMIEYPDLNGPVNRDITGTNKCKSGNVIILILNILEKLYN